MSDDRLEEPEPERESAFGRHLREQRRRPMPWLRLGIMVAVLVGLLVFYGNISRSVAGCFGRYVEADQSKKKPDAAGVPDGMLRIEPARRLEDPKPGGAGGPATPQDAAP